MFDQNDHRFMARAIELARRGRYTTHPNPRVGCVIVRDGVVVGEGWHERAGQAHAEINALAQAGALAVGATVYVTLEPCCHHGRTPPCSEALIGAEVARVVAAMEDPNPKMAGKGLMQLRAAGIRTACGLMQAQAEQLNPGFIKRMRQGLPYVRCKMAMSLDGRTSLASGESKWISCADARRDVQRLRAGSSAILSGIGTVLADDPQLTIRAEQWLEAERGDIAHRDQPLRVIVDSHLRMPVTARMLKEQGETWVFSTLSGASQMAGLKQAGANVILLDSATASVDLHRVMAALAQAEVNEILVEAGPTLNGALLEADLVDEIIIYLAPHLLGDGARGLCHLPGITSMTQRRQLDILDIRAVGSDWRITARPR